MFRPCHNLIDFISESNHISSTSHPKLIFYILPICDDKIQRSASQLLLECRANHCRLKWEIFIRNCVLHFCVTNSGAVTLSSVDVDRFTSLRWVCVLTQTTTPSQNTLRKWKRRNFIDASSRRLQFCQQYPSFGVHDFGELHFRFRLINATASTLRFIRARRRANVSSIETTKLQKH